MRHWIYIIITLLFSLFLVACNNAEVEMPQSREAYEAEIQARVDELEQQIEALRIEAEQRIGEEITEEDVQRTIAELEVQLEVVAQELEEFAATSEEAWEDFRPGLEAALDELEAAFQRARANFEES